MVDFPDSPAPGRFGQEQILWWGSSSFTKQKHFDLIALQKLISFELILYLLIPLFPLPLLGAHPATHLGDVFFRLLAVEGGRRRSLP